MVMIAAGQQAEKDCAGDAQQQPKTTDQSSLQRGRPTSTNPLLSKIIKEKATDRRS
jgi:hypothetical protein